MRYALLLGVLSLVAACAPAENGWVTPAGVRIETQGFSLGTPEEAAQVEAELLAGLGWGKAAEDCLSRARVRVINGPVWCSSLWADGCQRHGIIDVREAPCARVSKLSHEELHWLHECTGLPADTGHQRQAEWALIAAIELRGCQ